MLAYAGRGGLLRQRLATPFDIMKRVCFTTDETRKDVCEGDLDKSSLEERKRRSIQTYLEQQLCVSDPDYGTLAVLLQHHGVVVRGGKAEALRLMEALAAWKLGKWEPPEEKPRNASGNGD
ncbi:hypothetical protein Vretimale_16845 [Volvox reticuliferus]|uniref:Uncharacterized protein n=1 Tax=Volvox reticuliferus TaxID=1737510 RepID=A0A8J4LXR5_9CHLO|nr:hypothetical protein Vretimale_16845 [Volvox reticuliferus]